MPADGSTEPVGCVGPEGWHRTMVIFAVRSASDRAWAFFLPLVLSSVALDRGDSSWLLTGSAGLYAMRTAVEIPALPVAAYFWKGTPKCTAAFLAAENVCLIASAWTLLLLKARAETREVPPFTQVRLHVLARDHLPSCPRSVEKSRAPSPVIITSWRSSWCTGSRRRSRRLYPRLCGMQWKSSLLTWRQKVNMREADLRSCGWLLATRRSPESIWL